MKLKKCETCNKYTLRKNCPKCQQKTKNAHYKFIHIRSVDSNKK